MGIPRTPRVFSTLWPLYWEEYQNINIADLAAVALYTFRETESLGCKLDKFNLMAKDLDIIIKPTSKQDECIYLTKSYAN